MTMDKLRTLYGDKYQQMAILDHADHPRHRGNLQESCVIDLNNPTCGDVIRLFVKFDQEKIADLSFTGQGCTISTASASMMSEVLIGKTKAEALALADEFSKLITEQPLTNEESLGDAIFLSGVAKFPQRVKCATLAWNALKKAIETDDFAELRLTHESGETGE